MTTNGNGKRKTGKTITEPVQTTEQLESLLKEKAAMQEQRIEANVMKDAESTSRQEQSNTLRASHQDALKTNAAQDQEQHKENMNRTFPLDNITDTDSPPQDVEEIKAAVHEQPVGDTNIVKDVESTSRLEL